jgi:hypothetical protein
MSILSSCVSSPVGNLEISAVDGKVKLPLGKNSFATVGVRPESALGRIRAGRKPKWAKVWLEESGIRSCKRCKGGYQLWEARLGQ